MWRNAFDMGFGRICEGLTARGRGHATSLAVYLLPQAVVFTAG